MKKNKRFFEIIELCKLYNEGNFIKRSYERGINPLPALRDILLLKTYKNGVDTKDGINEFLFSIMLNRQDNRYLFCHLPYGEDVEVKYRDCSISYINTEKDFSVLINENGDISIFVNGLLRYEDGKFISYNFIPEDIRDYEFANS
jgi:hypothetical protein